MIGGQKSLCSEAFEDVYASQRGVGISTFLTPVRILSLPHPWVSWKANILEANRCECPHSLETLETRSSQSEVTGTLCMLCGYMEHNVWCKDTGI